MFFGSKISNDFSPTFAEQKFIFCRVWRCVYWRATKRHCDTHKRYKNSFHCEIILPQAAGLLSVGFKLYSRDFIVVAITNTKWHFVARQSTILVVVTLTSATKRRLIIGYFQATWSVYRLYHLYHHSDQHHIKTPNQRRVGYGLCKYHSQHAPFHH